MIIFKPEVAGFYAALGAVAGVVFGFAGLWLVDEAGFPVWAGLSVALGGVICCAGPIAAVLAFGFGYTMLRRRFAHYGDGD